MIGSIIGTIAGVAAGSVARTALDVVVKPQNLTKVSKVVYKVGAVAMCGTIGTVVGDDWEKFVNDILPSKKTKDEEELTEEEVLEEYEKRFKTE